MQHCALRIVSVQPLSLFCSESGGVRCAALALYSVHQPEWIEEREQEKEVVRSLHQGVAALEQDVGVQINLVPEVFDALCQVFSSLSQAVAAIKQDFSVQVNVTPAVRLIVPGRQLVEPGRCSD